jgi:hypothetical protein
LAHLQTTLWFALLIRVSILPLFPITGSLSELTVPLVFELSIPFESNPKRIVTSLLAHTGIDVTHLDFGLSMGQFCERTGVINIQSLKIGSKSSASKIHTSQKLPVPNFQRWHFRQSSMFRLSATTSPINHFIKRG